MSVTNQWRVLQRYPAVAAVFVWFRFLQHIHKLENPVTMTTEVGFW